MKFLVAILMTTALTGTAFGACSATSPNECTTKKECEDLSKEGQKFIFNESGKVKCMVSETAVATNCLENNNSSLTPVKTETGGKDGKQPSANGVTK